jgi:hypothetical protein
MRESCRKAKDLAGVVAARISFNLPDGASAVAVVVDPAGHPVGLYSRTPLPPDPTPAR